MIRISIIIISYNTRKILDDCLKSVYSSLKLSKIEVMSEIIVVDNNSTDGSMKMVEKKYCGVKLIKNRSNIGFGGANNQGIKIASGKYVLLLNSDTLVKKDAIEKMFDFMEKNQETAVLGPKILNPDSTLQYSAGFLPTLINIFFWMFFLDDIPLVSRLIKSYHINDNKYYQNLNEAGWLTGACLFIRKEIFGDSTFFDEHIFMYGEEVELCRKINKKGGKIIYFPDAQIIHLKGGSSNIGSDAGILEEYKFVKYFFKQYGNVFQFRTVLWMLRIGALLRIIIFGIIGRYSKRIPIYAKALKTI